MKIFFIYKNIIIKYFFLNKGIGGDNYMQKCKIFEYKNFGR